MFLGTIVSQLIMPREMNSLEVTLSILLGGGKLALTGLLAKELLHSKHTGKSKWFPYLDMLPWQKNDQEHILWWSDKEVEERMAETYDYKKVLDFRDGVSSRTSQQSEWHHLSYHWYCTQKLLVV